MTDVLWRTQDSLATGISIGMCRQVEIEVSLKAVVVV